MKERNGLIKYMKKTVYIVVTFLVMLITSRFVVRIVDATVQIDDDVWLLVSLLVLLNAAIALLSRLLYRRTSAGKKS